MELPRQKETSLLDETDKKCLHSLRSDQNQ